MIRRPDLHWPAAAGCLLAVVTVVACVPANADSVTSGTPTASRTPAAAVSPVERTTPAIPSSAPPVPANPASAAPAPASKASTSASATPSRAASTAPARAASATTAPTPEPAKTVRPGGAVITLATLTIKGRAPRTGYDRDLFGQAWADVDRNGCDTRNDILRRDLNRYTLKPGTHGCLVLKGSLDDPYTGTTISFARGVGTSNAVQIDHVVALSDAWQKGAQSWSTTTRKAFANDPLNLLAVDGPTNLRKGNGDAATWLPPRKAFRCEYVALQIAVKHRYALSVTSAERDAMVRVLTTCPSQALPTAGVIALG